MLAVLRLFAIILVVQSISYVLLSLYSRSVRRAKLRAHWDSKGLEGDGEAFVERGLKKYDGSFRRKLILGVYFVPWLAIAIVIYVVNFM